MTEGVRRVALITGASRGVGASIATTLADREFNVVITVAEFAFAIAEAVTTAHPSGHTVFVGITD
jgi:NAD(P)-dependent dehydrogenase (short-subunit alcohol dehydrogenase family)